MASEGRSGVSKIFCREKVEEVVWKFARVLLAANTTLAGDVRVSTERSGRVSDAIVVSQQLIVGMYRRTGSLEYHERGPMRRCCHVVS